MLASEIYDQKKIRLIDIPEPSPKGEPGHLLVQPELGCLCGSDGPYWEEFHNSEMLLQPGHSLHEIVARVLVSGDSILEEGSRIVCKVPDQRGLRERFWLPEIEAVPLPPELSNEQCVLAQPLGTVILALRKIPSLSGRTAVVVGQGPMGQLWNAALKVHNASQIIGIDPVPERLETSRHMGATDVVNPSTADPVKAVADWTSGKGADFVVEAVGHGAWAINLCVDLCRKHGTILAFGIPSKDIAIDIKNLFRKNIRLDTSVEPDPSRDYSRALAWIRDGKINVSPLITHHFPITAIQEAFELFSSRKDGAIKVFIEFTGSNILPD